MNYLPFFIAYRYLRQPTHRTSIATMMRICFLSICLGSFSLALVSAIMHGLHKAIEQKMKTIHADITLTSHDELNIARLRSFLQNHFKDKIVSSSPLMLNHALIQPKESNTTPHVVMLRGIDPVQEEATTDIYQKITFPEHAHLTDILHNNQVLIGKKLAESLGVSVGNVIDLYYIDELAPRKRKITLQHTTAPIGGIFSTGIDEFDSNILFTTLPFLHTLFPDDTITQLNIRIAATADERSMVHQLARLLEPDITVYSWKDLYPALLSALALERYAMFFIIALITLVATMNMIALLFMQINQKRSDIAILKAMGASDRSISILFASLGMLISVTATITGLLLAVGVSWFLNYYPFITLPDAYYVSHLPAQMSWQIIASVFVTVLTLTLFAIWIPIRRTYSITIAHVLRFEG